MTKMSPLFNNFPARAVIAATAAGFITACSHPLLNKDSDINVLAPLSNQEVTSQDLPAENENVPQPKKSNVRTTKRVPVAKHKAAKKLSRSSAIVSHTKTKEPKATQPQVVAQVDESNMSKPPPMQMVNTHEDQASSIPKIAIEEPDYNYWLVWIIGALAVAVMITIMRRAARARRERQHLYS